MGANCNVWIAHFITLTSVKQLTISRLWRHWCYNYWLKSGTSVRAKDADGWNDSVLCRPMNCWGNQFSEEVHPINLIKDPPLAAAILYWWPAGSDHGLGIAYSCLRSNLMFPIVLFHFWSWSGWKGIIKTIIVAKDTPIYSKNIQRLTSDFEDIYLWDIFTDQINM